MSLSLRIDLKLTRHLRKWWTVSTEYLLKGLRIPFIIFVILCQTCARSGPICLTYSVVAFAINLGRVANAPINLPHAHTSLPSALITEPLLIGVISSSHRSSPRPCPSQPSTRSLLARQRPSPLTDGRSSSTTTLLPGGKKNYSPFSIIRHLYCRSY